MTTQERVLEALDGVIDPELDQSITSLRFVSSVEIDREGGVEVVMRLPTPQCAPNFAFLMAADAREAVRRLPGVHRVSVKLEGHFTGHEINAALQRGEGFAGAFPGETEDDDLGALRDLFQRKALVARESRLCEALLADGATPEDVTGRRVRDLPDVPDARRCVKLREDLGIACTPDAPAFVLPSGEPVAPGNLNRWLRTARLVRMSLEVNGGICRSLLQLRHGLPIEDPEEEVLT